MQITTAGRETGSDVAHERLFTPSINITEPGYVYIYVSNEDLAAPKDVFFDDFSVTQVKTPIVQVEDYYPFGLTFIAYQRDSSMPDQYLYNGKELQDELSLGWLDYGARMYMPELGRWGVVDPYAGKYISDSPYNYAFNAPSLIVDPDGREGTIYLQVLINKKGVESKRNKELINLVNIAVNTLNALFANKGIDAKVESHIGTNVMSKTEFYSRDGGSSKDTYGLIGSNSQLVRANAEAGRKGWTPAEEFNGNQFNEVSGSASKKDRFFVMNSDNIADFSAPTKFQMDGTPEPTPAINSGNEDFRYAHQKAFITIMHEDGHRKFTRHPGHWIGNHLENTLMQVQPRLNSTYDDWMIDKLKEFHGARRESQAR